jgi:predicted transcriptional regulator
LTREERELAFAMRLDGKTWEEIAEAIGYDTESVRKDIERVLHRKHYSRIIYPAIKDYIQRECNGSIYSFACRCNMSKSTMYSIICEGEKPSRKSVAKILEETGLKYKEAFSK